LLCYTDGEVIFFMKKIFLFCLILLVLISGFVSGLAYERYVHREECLKIAMENSASEVLSEEEIDGIVKVLNGKKEGVMSNKEGETRNEKQETGNEKEEKDNEGKSNGVMSNRDSSFVGSRNSNKFYPVSCRYAKLIKEENKVWFESVEEGEKQGREYVECK